jgi:adenosylcobinamide hydrolase
VTDWSGTTAVDVAADVLRLRRPEMRWLSTAWDGGFTGGGVAYNISVPEGWERTDLDAYVRERCDDAGFDESGPSLLTGVDMRHARVARAGPVLAAATAGVSNPASLPVPVTDSRGDVRGEETAHADSRPADTPGRGTVNVLLTVDCRLDDGALANLVAVAAEAKAATLLATTGFPGTTTDAVVVGSARDAEPAAFSGSATPVGSAARACVRDAVRASLASRYDAGDRSIPDSVADAEYGVVTDRDTEVFAP